MKMQTPFRMFSFYLLPNFSLQAFSCAVEVLRLANEVLGEEAYEWRVVSGDGQPVMSSARQSVSADLSLKFERDRVHETNVPLAVVICGGSTFPAGNLQLDAWLRDCRKRDVSIVGIASGSVVLAKSGLADGHRCAIHWEQFPVFSEYFPDVVATQAAFEEDEQLYTCCGGGASFDMFLHFVKRSHGRAITDRICEKAIAQGFRSAGDRQRLPLRARQKFNQQPVLGVIDQMEANVSNPVPVDALIARTGMSRRQIERLFEREVGRSPSRYYLELRLERAHLLLTSSSLPVLEIAIACGFASASHFSKVYRQVYGCNPSRTRLSRKADARASPSSIQPSQTAGLSVGPPHRRNPYILPGHERWDRDVAVPCR